ADATPLSKKSPRTTAGTICNRFIVLLFMTFILYQTFPMAEPYFHVGPHHSRRSLSEEDRTGARTMNLDVTSCAVRVLRVLVMRRSGRLDCANIVRQTVTCQTELIHRAISQQPRIC